MTFEFAQLNIIFIIILTFFSFYHKKKDMTLNFCLERDSCIYSSISWKHLYESLVYWPTSAIFESIARLPESEWRAEARVLPSISSDARQTGFDALCVNIREGGAGTWWGRWSGCLWDRWIDAQTHTLTLTNILRMRRGAAARVCPFVRSQDRPAAAPRVSWTCVHAATKLCAFSTIYFFYSQDWMSAVYQSFLDAKHLY